LTAVREIAENWPKGGKAVLLTSYCVKNYYYYFLYNAC